MTQATPFRGVFALRWQQTEIDGIRGIDPGWLRVGASWSWQGESLRLDGAPSVLPLGSDSEHTRTHTGARAMAERLSGDIRPIPAILAQHDAPANGFVLTDGTRLYTARMIAQGSDWLIAFAGTLPPAGMTCWVTACNLTAALRAAQMAQDVICFTSDAMITTAAGRTPIAQLQPGDRVMTRDNGAQPVLWVGQTTLSGLALRQHPHLRPVRLRRGAVQQGLPDEDLCVSPAHRILVTGRRARALFGCDEVLARASDLVDYHHIAPDLALHGVTYVHLLFDAHQVIFANGLATESFHPALAPAATLRQHRHALSQLGLDWLDMPETYGPTARRCLSAGETALLAA
ncbi:MAG: Hint domain-containing protein [Natronohydrobacter sp.]|nr:Hint domain-containing protein [Natronohydrobacter sp.]